MLSIVDWLCMYIFGGAQRQEKKKNANYSNCDVLIISCVVHGNCKSVTFFEAAFPSKVLAAVF